MICTGNICRSPMAEGILMSLLPPPFRERVRVISAGTSALTDYPADFRAVEVMAEWGIDITRHRAKPVTPQEIRRSQLILGMTSEHTRLLRQMAPEASERIFPIGTFGPVRDIPDPFGGSHEEFHTCARQIRETLAHWIRFISQALPEDFS